MPLSFSRIGNALPFSRIFRSNNGMTIWLIGIAFISALLRQLEQEMETVVKVLQPGPLGIIEHVFSAEEIREANATVRRAVENWQRNAKLEQRNGILKDYIHQ